MRTLKIEIQGRSFREAVLTRGRKGQVEVRLWGLSNARGTVTLKPHEERTVRPTAASARWLQEELDGSKGTPARVAVFRKVLRDLSK